MKHKTSELSGALLDAAVAKAEGRLVLEDEPGWPKGDYLALRKEFGGQHVVRWYSGSGELGGWEPLSNQGSPSTRWEDCGHLIERERIKLEPVDAGGMFIGVRQDRDGWLAKCPEAFTMERGDTALIAACRAFVAHKLGDEVDL